MKYLKDSLLRKYIANYNFQEARVLHIPNEHINTLEREPFTLSNATVVVSEDQPPLMAVGRIQYQPMHQPFPASSAAAAAFTLAAYPAQQHQYLQQEQYSPQEQFQYQGGNMAQSPLGGVMGELQQLSLGSPTGSQAGAAFGRFDDEDTIESSRRAGKKQTAVDQGQGQSSSYTQPQNQPLDEVCLISLPTNEIDEKTIETLWKSFPSAWWIDLSSNHIKTLAGLQHLPLAMGSLDLRFNQSLHLTEPSDLYYIAQVHILRLNLSPEALISTEAVNNIADACSSGGTNGGVGSCHPLLLWEGVLTVAANLPNVWVFNDHYISFQEKQLAMSRGYQLTENMSKKKDNHGDNGESDNKKEPWKNIPTSERQGNLLTTVLALQNPNKHTDCLRLEVLLEDYLHYAFMANEYRKTLSINNNSAIKIKEMKLIPTLSNIDLLLFLPHRIRLDLTVLLTINIMFPTLPKEIMKDTLIILLSSYLPLYDIEAIPKLPNCIKTALVAILRRISLKESDEYSSYQCLSRKPRRPLQDWIKLRDVSATIPLPTPTFVGTAGSAGFYYLHVIKQYLSKSYYLATDYIDNDLDRNEGFTNGNTNGSNNSGPAVSGPCQNKDNPSATYINAFHFTKSYLQQYSINSKISFSELEMDLLQQLPDIPTKWLGIKDLPIKLTEEDIIKGNSDSGEQDEDFIKRFQQEFIKYDHLFHVPRYHNWVAFASRHAILLMNKAPSCPSLTKPASSNQEQTYYLDLLPILKAADMTLLDLELTGSHGGITAGIAGVTSNVDIGGRVIKNATKIANLRVNITANLNNTLLLSSSSALGAKLAGTVVAGGGSGGAHGAGALSRHAQRLQSAMALIKGQVLPFGLGLPRASVDTLDWNAHKDVVPSKVTSRRGTAPATNSPRKSPPRSPMSRFTDGGMTTPGSLDSSKVGASEEPTPASGAFFVTEGGDEGPSIQFTTQQVAPMIVTNEDYLRSYYNVVHDPKNPNAAIDATGNSAVNSSINIGTKKKIKLLPAKDPKVYRLVDETTMDKEVEPYLLKYYENTGGVGMANGMVAMPSAMSPPRSRSQSPTEVVPPKYLYPRSSVQGSLSPEIIPPSDRVYNPEAAPTQINATFTSQYAGLWHGQGTLNVPDGTSGRVVGPHGAVLSPILSGLQSNSLTSEDGAGIQVPLPELFPPEFQPHSRLGSANTLLRKIIVTNTGNNSRSISRSVSEAETPHLMSRPMSRSGGMVPANGAVPLANRSSMQEGINPSHGPGLGVAVIMEDSSVPSTAAPSINTRASISQAQIDAFHAIGASASADGYDNFSPNHSMSMSFDERDLKFDNASIRSQGFVVLPGILQHQPSDLDDDLSSVVSNNSHNSHNSHRSDGSGKARRKRRPVHDEDDDDDDGSMDLRSLLHRPDHHRLSNASLMSGESLGSGHKSHHSHGSHGGNSHNGSHAGSHVSHHSHHSHRTSGSHGSHKSGSHGGALPQSNSVFEVTIRESRPESPGSTMLHSYGGGMTGPSVANTSLSLGAAGHLHGSQMYPFVPTNSGSVGGSHGGALGGASEYPFPYPYPGTSLAYLNQQQQQAALLAAGGDATATGKSRPGSPHRSLHKVDIFTADAFTKAQFLVAPQKAVESFNNQVKEVLATVAVDDVNPNDAHALLLGRNISSPERTNGIDSMDTYWRKLENPPLLLIPTTIVSPTKQLRVAKKTFTPSKMDTLFLSPNNIMKETMKHMEATAGINSTGETSRNADESGQTEVINEKEKLTIQPFSSSVPGPISPTQPQSGNDTQPPRLSTGASSKFNLHSPQQRSGAHSPVNKSTLGSRTQSFSWNNKVPSPNPMLNTGSTSPAKSEVFQHMTDDLPITGRDSIDAGGSLGSKSGVSGEASIQGSLDSGASKASRRISAVDAFLHEAVLQVTDEEEKEKKKRDRSKSPKKKVVIDKPKEIYFDPEAGKSFIIHFDDYYIDLFSLSLSLSLHSCIRTIS